VFKFQAFLVGSSQRLDTFLSRSKGQKQVFLSLSFGKPPKSPKLSLLQNHHYKTNMGTKRTVVKHIQNSYFLIRWPSFNEEGLIFN
jgi:hypothetical protein